MCGSRGDERPNSGARIERREVGKREMSIVSSNADEPSNKAVWTRERDVERDARRAGVSFRGGNVRKGGIR